MARIKQGKRKGIQFERDVLADLCGKYITNREKNSSKEYVPGFLDKMKTKYSVLKGWHGVRSAGSRAGSAGKLSGDSWFGSGGDLKIELLLDNVAPLSLVVNIQCKLTWISEKLAKQLIDKFRKELGREGNCFISYSYKGTGIMYYPDLPAWIETMLIKYS